MKPVAISDQKSNQQIIKAVIADVISSLSTGILSYGLAFMLLYNTHSPLSFGLGVAIDPVIDLLFFIPIGNFVDQHRHKPILITNYGLRLLLLISFMLILPRFARTDQLIPVIIFMSFAALFSNIDNTAYTASVHELVNPHKISALNSYEQSCSVGANFFAPILGVILYNLVNINTFLIIDFVADALALGITLAMHFHITANTKKVTKIHKNRQIHDFKIGMNYIRHRKLIQTLMGLAIIANLLGSLLNVAPAYEIVNRLHLSNTVVSSLDASLFFGIVVGSLSNHLIFKNVSLFVKFLWGFITVGLCTIGLGLTFTYIRTFWITTILGTLITLIIGGTLGLANTATAVRIQSTIPTKLMGRVGSAFSAVCTMAMPIGTLVFSYLLKEINDDALIFIVTGILLIILFWASAPKLYKAINSDDQRIADHPVH